MENKVKEVENVEEKFYTINEIRNEEGNIDHYSFIIKKKPQDIIGKLSREEMENIIFLYSNKGAKQTASMVSKNFKWTTSDFKAILRAFNITKEVNFAPHQIEENDEETLLTILYNRKEKRIIKKAEMEQYNELEKRYQSAVSNLYRLKKEQESITNILSNVPDYTIQVDTNYNYKPDSHLLVYLSDWHIGARVDNPLYPNNWNYKEAENRINHLVESLPKMSYESLTICVLGDMIDGFNSTTVRGGHTLPTNMGNMEQVNTYVNLLSYCIEQLITKLPAKYIDLKTVQEGNHDGYSIGVITKLVFDKFSLLNPNVSSEIASSFYLNFCVKDRAFILTHGKDGNYKKQGLALNVTEKNKVEFLEYISYLKLDPKDGPIHIIKGDLHQENLNQVSYNIDCRTVSSLFGASDYSQMNFSRTSPGTSYDLILGDNMLRGVINH